MRDRLQILAVAAVLSGMAPAWANPVRSGFGYVQQMLAQSAKNDTAGTNAALRQLESVPRPAHQNVKEARALNKQGLEALRRNDFSAALDASSKPSRPIPPMSRSAAISVTSN